MYNYTLLNTLQSKIILSFVQGKGDDVLFGSSGFTRIEPGRYESDRNGTTQGMIALILNTIGKIKIKGCNVEINHCSFTTNKMNIKLKTAF